MIKNYLLITLRSMMKSKVYMFINLFGLAIAIGCCITAYFNWNFNMSFDSNHVNAAQIYRVNSLRTFEGRETPFGVTPLPLGDIARDNVKDFTAVSRYNGTYADVRVGDEVFDNHISYVDPDLFKMFTFEFLHGDASVINDKSKIILNDENAIRLFGTVNAVGKTMTIVRDGRPWKEYEVGAVYKLPQVNSSFGDRSFALFDNYFDLDSALQRGTNWKYRTNLFVMLPDANRVEAVESQLKPFTENNNKVREDFVISRYQLDPFVGMAVRDEYEDRNGTWTRSGAPHAAMVATPIMAILILLIACFNLTNTTVAMSSRRLKEIGIRKVMGSMRKQLILQFMGETFFVCVFALILGFIAADAFLIPSFNALWPYMKIETNYSENLQFVVMIVGVLLLTALLAGSYPALYISKFQPTAILKGNLKFGGSSVLSKVLLSLQFAISLAAIVSSIGFVENARYQRDLDIGFNRNATLFTWVNSEDEYNALKNAMLENPDVKSVAGSQHQIMANSYSDPIKSGTKEIEVDILHVGPDYIPTVGMTLVEGRNFDKDSETDRKESVIITNKVARQFGWDQPIGQEIVWMDTVKLYVVGVVKDVYNRGVWRDMEPMILRYSAPKDYKHLSVTASAAKLSDVNKYMESKWKEIFPNRKFASQYLDDELAEAAQVNNNIVKMFIFLGGVALLLSVTGLFTLVSLNIIKKMKEIGVRKVLGASIANISRVINFEFLVILLISCIIGGVLGIFMSNALMGSIWRFYEKISIMTIVISSVLMLLLSALTVAFKTYNTVKMNPVKVLRDE